MAKIIREIIIMLLICLITMLLLAIGLYQYIPNRKMVPEIVKYSASEEVKDLLDDNINTKEEDKVLLTYEVTSGDLNNYQITNDYVPGKSNPFATYNTGESSTEYEEKTNEQNPNEQNSTNNDEKNNSVSTDQTVKPNNPTVYSNNQTK